MEQTILETIHKPILNLSDVMLITGRGKDYCRTLMDKIVINHKKFYDNHFDEYRCKYIKAKHLYEALGYSDNEYYNLFTRAKV